MGSGDFVLPKTYSGLLDDVVERHKITPEVDSTFFSRSILRNLFFSGPVYLNDGYLVNHPSSLQQLLDEESLLRTMVKNGFIELLVRQPNADAFAKNPEKMADRGIVSFKKLVDSPEWPNVRRRLARWAEGYYAENRVVPWPNFQMHQGFQRLFQRVFDKDLEDLGLSHISGFRLDEFRRRYEEHDAYAYGPRTAVEEALVGMVTDGLLDQPHIAEIMNVANQCYHYNFAMCLSKSDGQPVIADTTIGKAFEDILDLDQTVEAEVDDIPVLSIPRGFPTDRGSHFEVFLDPGSDIGFAKRSFLSELDRVFKPRGNHSAHQQISIVKEASSAYQSALAEYFTGKIGLSDWKPRTGALVTFGLGKLGSAFGADYAMLAANLATGGRASSFIHRMTRPLSKRILEVAFDPQAGDSDTIDFTVGEVRPRFASLAFDPKAVDRHTKDLPPMF